MCKCSNTVINSELFKNFTHYWIKDYGLISNKIHGPYELPK